MNRRGFLMGAGGILALAAAPAIVRADSLMRIVPVETTLLFPMGDPRWWYRVTGRAVEAHSVTTTFHYQQSQRSPGPDWFEAEVRINMGSEGYTHTISMPKLWAESNQDTVK